jgi:hypothetical protein
VVPLVTTELERLISSRTLSDLLASIGQKELDTITKNEETVAQMRVEMTGAHTVAHQVGKAQPQNFESRPNITTQFLDGTFNKKAADLGVAVQWIDIGTWQVASSHHQRKAERRMEVDPRKHQTEEITSNA